MSAADDLKPHLFVIGMEALRTISKQDTDAIVADLKEMDLYKLPYKKCVVRIPFLVSSQRSSNPKFSYLDKFTHYYKDGKGQYIYIPGAWFECHLYNQTALMFNDGSNPDFRARPYAPQDTSDKEFSVKICESSQNVLIALLATRNIRKTTKIDKLARCGIGKKGRHKFVYTTTISLPHPRDIQDDRELSIPGKPKIAHLRRGHIRRQHHGPNNCFIKKIWIEPLIVNADADFVDKRYAYNVSMNL